MYTSTSYLIFGANARSLGLLGKDAASFESSEVIT